MSTSASIGEARLSGWIKDPWEPSALESIVQEECDHLKSLHEKKKLCGSAKDYTTFAPSTRKNATDMVRITISFNENSSGGEGHEAWEIRNQEAMKHHKQELKSVIRQALSHIHDDYEYVLDNIPEDGGFQPHSRQFTLSIWSAEGARYEALKGSLLEDSEWSLSLWANTAQTASRPRPAEDAASPKSRGKMEKEDDEDGDGSSRSKDSGGSSQRSDPSGPFAAIWT